MFKKSILALSIFVCNNLCASQDRSEIPKLIEHYATHSFEKYNESSVISVENNCGKTVIQGWDRNLVFFQILKKASTQTILDAIHTNHAVNAEGVQITTDHSKAEILSSVDTAIHGSDSNEFSSIVGEVDYLIQIPNKARLTVCSQSGSIKIKKMLGMVSAKTDTGDIEVTQAQGNVVTTTTSGATKIKGRVNSAHMNSTEGSLKISGTAQDVRAHTKSGSIHAKGYFDKVSATSISGDIDVDKAIVSEVSTMHGTEKSKAWNIFGDEKTWSDDSSNDEA